MAKQTPNLPASSRMQMPSGNGGTKNISIKGSKGTSKKVMSGAKGLKGKNPYC
jgi:hypothetical protein